MRIETLFVQLQCLIQTPFSSTPALIHPSIYSCLDPVFLSLYKSDQSSGRFSLSATLYPAAQITQLAPMLTVPIGYNSVRYLLGKGINIINFGGGYFLQRARGLKAISCISSKWQSFTKHTLVLFSHLPSVQYSGSGMCFRMWDLYYPQTQGTSPRTFPSPSELPPNTGWVVLSHTSSWTKAKAWCAQKHG